MISDEVWSGSLCMLHHRRGLLPGETLVWSLLDGGMKALHQYVHLQCSQWGCLQWFCHRSSCEISKHVNSWLCPHMRHRCMELLYSPSGLECFVNSSIFRTIITKWTSDSTSDSFTNSLSMVNVFPFPCFPNITFTDEYLHISGWMVDILVLLNLSLLLANELFSNRLVTDVNGDSWPLFHFAFVSLSYAFNHH